ncbi:HelD family protein [Paenibacillus sp. 1P07SE]|uniref:HelD family protein n=1 Tax=Paenibacillus sp. 1P07SE TaxID=3132209 RepID=UPI0039A62BC1
MEQSQAYREESERLEETQHEIGRQLARIGGRYYGDDFLEQVLDARRLEQRDTLERLQQEPYFGRLDFLEDGADEAAVLYIGKRGMEQDGSQQPYVIDWRAPVASLFYSFSGGEQPVSYEAPEGEIHGEVHRKRNLSIRGRQLQRVVDSYERGGDNLGLSDEFLLYRLGERKDNRLRDIVSTIQSEQDRIIRAERNLALIIQGAAGSGKTTVALHRLAFLLYRYQGQIRAERMIVFAPNAMFLDYISGVLPELGVGDVKQTTFADWALGLLDGDVQLAVSSGGGKADWFALAGQRPPMNDFTPGRLKGSLAFKAWLAEQLQVYEAAFLPAGNFEAWDGMSLPHREIKAWFEVEYRYDPLAPRRERLLARMNRWLEMALNEVADPKRRKALAKTARARHRAYAKKLPGADALTVYRWIVERAAVTSGAGGDGSKGQAGERAVIAGAESTGELAPRQRPGGDGDTGQTGERAAGAHDERRAFAMPAELQRATLGLLKKKLAAPEDLPPLAMLHILLHGWVGPRFDHVVIDEAQDVSPFQIALLNDCMAESSFTILGDLAQGIHAYRGLQHWDELNTVFPQERQSYHELRLSYRSTMEIIAFANRFIPHTATGLQEAEPVFRSGEPVRLEVPEAGAEADWLLAYIRECREAGMETIALIGRTPQDCGQLYEALHVRDEALELHLVSEGQRSYAGGITILPAHLAKGLEFDAVVVCGVDSTRYTDTPEDAKLLYVACTRALHRLALLCGKDGSPLVGAER